MKFFLLAALFTIAAAGTIHNHGGDYAHGGHGYAGHGYGGQYASNQYVSNYNYHPAPYEIHWAVKEPYAYLDYGQDESSDGYKVSGKIYANLPGESYMSKHYTVDDGYHAGSNYGHGQGNHGAPY